MDVEGAELLVRRIRALAWIGVGVGLGVGLCVACDHASRQSPDVNLATPIGTMPAPAAKGSPRDEFSDGVIRPVAGDAAASAVALGRARQERAFGRHRLARHALDEALRHDPANVDALRECGSIALDRAAGFDPVQAILAFRTLRTLCPEDPTARLGELSAATAIGDLELARPLAAELSALLASGKLRLDDDGTASFVAAEAGIALLEGRPEAAVTAATRAARLRPTWHHLELLAHALEEAGQFEAALAPLHRALSERPDEASLHFAAGRVRRRLGHAAMAARHQRAYLALQPFENDSSNAFRDDHPRRIELRREFLATAPDLPLARHLLARELIDGGELAAATELLEPQATAQSGDPQVWYLLASLRARQKDGAGARAAANRMLATGKVPAEVHAELIREIEESLRAAR